MGRGKGRVDAKRRLKLRGGLGVAPDLQKVAAQTGVGNRRLGLEAQSFLEMRNRFGGASRNIRQVSSEVALRHEIVFRNTDGVLVKSLAVAPSIPPAPMPQTGTLRSKYSHCSDGGLCRGHLRTASCAPHASITKRPTMGTYI